VIEQSIFLVFVVDFGHGVSFVTLNGLAIDASIFQELVAIDSTVSTDRTRSLRLAEITAEVVGARIQS
jgi:hypothetical protein